jgi:hypothetical protein
MAVVEDEEAGSSYGVAYSSEADEFVVTDGNGDLLEDEALAQEILDDFIVFAEESAAEER